MKELGLIKFSENVFFNYGVVFVDTEEVVRIKKINTWFSFLGLSVFVIISFFCFLLSYLSILVGVTVFLVLFYFCTKWLGRHNSKKRKDNDFDEFDFEFSVEEVKSFKFVSSHFLKNYFLVVFDDFSFKLRGVRGDEEIIRFLIKALASKEELRGFKKALE
ncbi:hypothetical protein C9439_01540 [archaeon SCG-AAA382B04]|nr:hypothetical protein C9439_01540 [archaeon SCG-AAA382B04]